MYLLTIKVPCYTSKKLNLLAELTFLSIQIKTAWDKRIDFSLTLFLAYSVNEYIQRLY